MKIRIIFFLEHVLYEIFSCVFRREFKIIYFAKISLMKHCFVCERRRKACIRERIRAGWISSYRLRRDFPCALHACMYACAVLHIRSYRIDIQRARGRDCRHDVIKRITILRGAAMLNAPRTTLHYS